jgi:hypothetical protein
MVGDRFFIVYDCRNYKADYLGRVILVFGENDKDCFDDYGEPKFKEVRAALDNNEYLRAACTWRIKEIDGAILADFMEEFL